LPLPHLLGLAIATGLIATIAEAVSKRGSDNFTLTLAAALGMDLYLTNMQAGSLPALGGWFLFSILLGWGAYKLKALSLSGAFGAFLLGVFMFGSGGWATMLPLITFFVLSSLLSKLAERYAPRDDISSKGSRRDIVQVFANGGIPLILALVWYLSDFSAEWLYWAFLASMATATADTWETEIGSFVKQQPVSILTFNPVPRGFSGGVSLLGTLGGLVGAAVIAAVAYLSGSIAWDSHLLLLIILAGFAGTLVDSILGASIQAKFECTVCGKATEKLEHCGQATRHVAGILWFAPRAQ